ncbi:LysR family transcriptional regulator [Amycolatopsis sp. PS_44_ISF1]|uniref:LysR family transcriptional regulator n=1 Tax=Amycolatopsis sp. PS_44_ISF1 TaxID=2974917 RepID=UPI0028DF2AE8|nr:LysR family transcriptional regulator [Amycolatopsis sp. PS_44_ISF1]MDT8912570.1 LysR family transcriptional regulator [Amycolatopsis sp. PS_44_ISF1]
MAEQLDLNLLRVFDVLMDTGSVSEAAARLHLSVPATSRALGRLRVAMHDPILVRAGRGLVPTPFALASAAKVKALLEAAAGLRADPEGSDPRTWQRTFAIRVNDGLVPALAPRLINRIAAEAPDVRLRFAAQDSKEPDQLRDGSLDLEIGLAGPVPPDLVTRPLFPDHFVALVAADSPLGRAPALTVDDLCAHPHISASRRGRSRGPLDEALERVGRSRRVIAVVPSYAVACLIALEEDALCLVSRVMAQHLVERGVPVRWHEVPLELPPVEVELRWHRRLDEDPASRWLRDHLAAAVQPLIDSLG